MDESIVIPRQFLIKDDFLHKIHHQNTSDWDRIKSCRRRNTGSVHYDEKEWVPISTCKLKLNCKMYNILTDHELVDENKKMVHGGLWNSYPSHFNFPCEEFLKCRNMVIIGNCNGLGSCFIETIKWLIIADSYNLNPVVFWGDHTAYWDEESGGNAWNYYFKKVGDDSLYKSYTKDISNHFQQNGSKEYKKIVDDTIIIGISDDVKIPLFDGKIPFNFGFRSKGSIVNDYWRFTINKYIQQYVYVDSKIMENAENNINKMNKIKIGVHIRGANGFDECFLWRNNVYLDHYCEAIKDVIESNGGEDNTSIYLATDSKIALEYIQSKFNDVFHIDCTRTDSYYADRIGMSEVHSFGHMLDKRSQLGYEALLDCLVLSKCDYFIHYESNLAVMVAYFNPLIKLLHAQLYYNTQIKTDSVPAPCLILSNKCFNEMVEDLSTVENYSEKRHNILWIDWVKGKVQQK